MLGLSRDEILAAVSLAWVDGQPLRTYRHAPNTGSRKSWAAGDATARAVRLALMARTGEMGYPSVLSAKTWGFYDVLFKGRPFRFQRPYGSYVMENVLFKISFPAEFHAQTAVEAAMTIHAAMAKAGKSADDIGRVTIRTHEACLRIIDKQGPLDNPADRDHCIQYMVAVPLIHGRLTAADYEDDIAADPRIDAAARQDRLRRRPGLQRRLPRSVEALDRQRHDGANSTTAAGSTKSSSNTRSATRAAAPKASRCWSPSSRPTWRAASRPGSRTPSWPCRSTRQRSKRCRSTSTSTCM